MTTSVAFQSPNAVQLDEPYVPIKARLLTGLGKLVPYLVVVPVVIGIAAFAARQGLSLPAGLCVLLLIAPVSYLLGRFGGFILKMLGLFQEVRQRAAFRFDQVQVGLGPEVRVTLADWLRVEVGPAQHHFPWEKVRLLLSLRSTVLSIEGGRFVCVPHTAFASDAEREGFLVELRGRVRTVIDVRGDDAQMNTLMGQGDDDRR